MDGEVRGTGAVNRRRKAGGWLGGLLAGGGRTSIVERICNYMIGIDRIAFTVREGREQPALAECKANEVHILVANGKQVGSQESGR